MRKIAAPTPPEALALLEKNGFWSKVARGGPGDCWEWTRSRTACGYGRCGLNRLGSFVAHRVAWELTNGPIPDGLWVLHRCDNPPCCNPAHLFLGTPKDNNLDMRTKGRQGGQIQPSQFNGAKHRLSKLTEERVRRARERVARGESQTDIAEEYGVSIPTLHAAVRRRTWRHVA